MIDKSLVITRFKKSLKTYDENALIQKYTAEKLVKYLTKKKCKNILEIGCSSGVLTRQIKKNLSYEKFFANDIVAESEKYIVKIIPEVQFIEGDIEEIPLNDSYDLIISNACLQWCNNIEAVINKLYNALTPDGILLFSVFADENLKEIINIFKLPKRKLKLDKLKNNHENIIIESEIKKIYFNTPMEVLSHIKNTGANALGEFKFTKSKLQNFVKTYKTLYSEGEKVYLTYNPVYIKIKKLKNDIE